MEEKREFEICWTERNNHGCEGFHLAVESITPCIGKVVGAWGCTAAICGHNVTSFARMKGEIVKLPASFKGGSWEEAGRVTIRHRGSLSFFGGSAVHPNDLLRLHEEHNTIGNWFHEEPSRFWWAWGNECPLSPEEIEVLGLPSTPDARA